MDVGQSIAMYFAVAMAGPFLLHLFLKSIRQWRYRKILAEPEPRCRACGYIIVPGSSAICPECGGELRKVGAIAPSILPPPIPFPLMFLAFMICLPPACLMGFWMASHFPIGGGYQTIARWQETETMIGGRRLDVRFQMTAKGRSFFGRKRPDEV